MGTILLSLCTRIPSLNFSQYSKGLTFYNLKSQSASFAGKNVFQLCTNSFNLNIPVVPTIKNNEGDDSKSLLRLVAGYSGDSISFDPLVIYYDENATYNFDGQLDAFKFYNSDKNVTSFYVFGDDSSRLSIDAIPFPDNYNPCTLRLGLKTEKDGNVVFAIRDITGSFLEKNIYLKDIIEDTNYLLSTGNQYEIYLPSGNYQNRFYLIISDVITDIPDVTPEKLFINVYWSHGILRAEIILPDSIKGVLSICNLNGQILFNQKIYISGSYEFQPLLKNGIYIISFIYQDKKVSKRILICDS